MESINSGEANSNSKEVSISFARVEREEGTSRTLVLKHPNRYIPQFLEDLADIPLVLHMGNRKRIENLAHDTDEWNEFLSPSLEDLMFDDSKYLENSVFSTGHQSVNVYGLPEKRYEVRTEENAVDVQIYGKSSVRTTKLEA